MAAVTAAGVMTATGVMTSLNGWPFSPQPSRRNCDVDEMTAVGAMTAAVGATIAESR
jgi:hypothetical protein